MTALRLIPEVRAVFAFTHQRTFGLVATTGSNAPLFLVIRPIETNSRKSLGEHSN